MRLNNLEAAKSELQARGLNLPEKFENRVLNEKECKVFNWYVLLDTSITRGGNIAGTVTHMTLQAFDVNRMVSPSIKKILNSGNAILIHDMNKKEEAPKTTRGRKPKTEE